MKSEEMMNCKQGDLAVIVRSNLGNAGRIVTCLHLASLEELLSTFGSSMWPYGSIWRLDTSVRWSGSVSDAIDVPFMVDSVLRPLRDSDGEDEVLRLVGLPAGAPQAA